VKKIAAILLIFIYSASVYGFSVNKFYCCGKLGYVGICKKSIANCANKSDPSCCKTTKQEYKIKDNHIAAKASSTDYSLYVLINPALFIYEPAERISLKEASAYNSHAPPDQLNPFFILFCNYRI
jgi:hypothetical protein